MQVDYDQFDGVEQTSRTMSLRMSLLWSSVFFGPATYFLVQHDYVVAAMMFVAGFGAFTGYRTGILSIFASTMGLAAAVAFAPTIGMENAYRFSQWFGTSGLANRFLSIAAFGLCIGLFTTWCLWFILGRMVRRRGRLDSANRSLGFAFGAVQGIAGLVFFIGGMLVMEPIEQERVANRDPKDARGQFASRLILSTSEATRHSLVGPWLVQYNPLTMIPDLNKVEEYTRTAEVLADPVRMQQLLNEPEIQELRRKPPVQKLIIQLNEDPKIRELLDSGQPINAATAMTLLSHPAVMELVDQPGFLEEAAKAIQRAVPTPGFAH